MTRMLNRPNPTAGAKPQTRRLPDDIPEEQPTPATQKFFRLVESSTLHVLKNEALSLAQSHQTLPRSPTEREMEPKRVAELLNRIKGGVWLPCNWATVVYNGTKFRMNGQHSSQAILDGADFLPERVSIHLDQYEADSAEGMGQLFRQFDARFSGRSKQDVAGAYQGLAKELEGVNKRKGKLGIEGIGWYLRSIEGLPFSSGDDLYQELLSPRFHSFLRWMDKILSIKTPEMERAPIIGSMYATFITSESGAQEFWPHVAKSDLADDSDPRAVLSAELVRIKEDRKTSSPPLPAEFYAKCIKAWNAFRSGDKIRSLNVNTKKGLPDIAS